MKVPTYRVTEKKLKEYLGEEWEGYFNPFKSERFRLIFYILLVIIGFLISFLVLSAIKFSLWIDRSFQWFILIILFITVLLVILPYFLIKETFKREMAGKMKELVNDSELLWVNSQPPENFVTKWQRGRGTYFTPTTFQILSYLKREGTSSAIYTKIKSMKNSNSAYQSLKRLAEKKIFDEPIVKREGNDFKYVPWRFRLIDEQNQPIKNSEKKEKLLAKCWEEGLE